MSSFKNPHMLFKLILVIALLGIILILSLWYNQTQLHEMAPGVQMQESQDSFILADGGANTVPMPTIQTPETHSPSFGTIHTPNGNYNLIGL